MTREEATKRVQAMVTYIETLDAKDIEAYNMAIKALEQTEDEEVITNQK